MHEVDGQLVILVDAHLNLVVVSQGMLAQERGYRRAQLVLCDHIVIRSRVRANGRYAIGVPQVLETPEAAGQPQVCREQQEEEPTHRRAAPL